MREGGRLGCLRHKRIGLTARVMDGQKESTTMILGYVYFAVCHDLCKIGFATNVVDRINALQVGCPYKIELVLAFRGTRTIEHKLQKVFKGYHHRGEWFVYDGALKKFVNHVQAEYGAEKARKSQ